MYNKLIIIGGSKFNCLNFIFIDTGTKSCANTNKMDISRVSTTQRSMNQLETLHRTKPSIDTNGFA